MTGGPIQQIVDADVVEHACRGLIDTQPAAGYGFCRRHCKDDVARDSTVNALTNIPACIERHGNT